MAKLVEREFFSRSPAQTEAVARRLAAAMHVPATLHLRGGLGAGKTLFARGFLRALGVRDRIPSPTFSLAELYAVGPRRFGHFDFFRCVSGREWLAAGLAEDMESLDACLVEWPENAEMLPEPDAVLSLVAGAHEKQRVCVLCGCSRAGIAWVGRA